VAACVGCYRSLVHFRQQYMARRNTKADSVDLEVQIEQYGPPVTPSSCGN
jgi:hypothetical protein